MPSDGKDVRQGSCNEPCRLSKRDSTHCHGLENLCPTAAFHTVSQWSQHALAAAPPSLRLLDAAHCQRSTCKSRKRVPPQVILLANSKVLVILLLARLL
jgi:hypothetical protein